MYLTPTLQVDDFFMLEDCFPVIATSVGVRVYDFDFRNHFEVKSLHYPPMQPVIARIGAIADYEQNYTALQKEGITLIHSPSEHDQCSFLPLWYPLLSDLTPKSIVYTHLPTAKIVEQDFDWPIFVKGERQTHKHKKSLSIIEDSKQFESLLVHWQQDSMLHWQKMVCRQFIPLQAVEKNLGDRLPSSFEFRLFYWKKKLISIGPYWYEASPYHLSELDRQMVVALGDEVARRLSAHFLVVDVAKTAEGQWILIEVNDGQESGYAGNNVGLLWRKVLELEQRN